VGVVLLGHKAGWSVPFLGASLLGMGMGGARDLMAFLISRYFGLRSFGLLYGRLCAHQRRQRNSTISADAAKVSPIFA
jgi:hypothetical protein